MDDLISRREATNELWSLNDQCDSIYYTKCIHDAVYALEILPSAQRWIPCSERLPDESGDYLLYRPHFWGANKGQITVCYWNGNDWSDNYKNDAERYLPIIMGMAWMPLPDPYREDGDNDD